MRRTMNVWIVLAAFACILAGFFWLFHSSEKNLDELKAVVDGVRSRYGLPELPFVCGGFCNEWAQKNQPASDRIMDVIRAVADECGGAYVETLDLRSNNQKTGNGDGIHFCRESLHILGKRYFDAYKEIISRGK